MATLARELEVVERIHTDLGFQVKQIARIVSADESTLHRWLSGASSPRSVYLTRLSALDELHRELLDAFSSLDAARDWLWHKHPAPLGGRTPAESLLEGKLERVVGLLWNLNNGMRS